MDGRVALGINVSIILILTIFTVILVLPLKLLLNTNYEIQRNSSANSTKLEKPPEFRNLQLCPGDYRHFVESTFVSSYDRNCTYENPNKKLKQVMSHGILNESGKSNTTNFSIGGFRVIRPKSGLVTDHIIAILLVVSVVLAFVELLRIRFTKPQVRQFQDTRSDAGVISRRQSIVDLMLPRRYVSREPVKGQLSLDMQKVHRSPLRVFAATTSQAGCVPPLIRRSSFPTYFSLDGTVSDSSTPPRSPRRPSVTVDGETGVNTSVLHRRARLIRR